MDASTLARCWSRTRRPFVGRILTGIVAGCVVACAVARAGADESNQAHAEAAKSTLTIASTEPAADDPFAAQPAVYIPFDLSELPPPVDVASYFAESPSVVSQCELQLLQPAADDTGQPAAADDRRTDGEELPKPTGDDPCAGVAEKPMDELGIGIAPPTGPMPTDFAAACWEYRNAMGYEIRCWPVLPFFWDATCLCYRPLYFEETNLERYGYGCCACIQPAVSAAHFFGTIPALPYCMAEHCPCQCEYTLGHYRPGSCPPWRHHWWSCRPLSVATEAGVMTGLIFLIP